LEKSGIMTSLCTVICYDGNCKILI